MLTRDGVFNCAPISDIEECEKDPALAYRVNTRPLALLADWSRKEARAIVHVSTDHFFTDGAGKAHREDEPASLVNEYARTKYASEAFALTSPYALVLRTSIIGIRNWPKPTLAEWAICAIEAGERMTLFDDAFTSSIDTGTCAGAALDLLSQGATGLVNLGSRQVYTKASLVREIARQLGRDLNEPLVGSVASL